MVLLDIPLRNRGCSLQKRIIMRFVFAQSTSGVRTHSIPFPFCLGADAALKCSSLWQRAEVMDTGDSLSLIIGMTHNNDLVFRQQRHVVSLWAEILCLRSRRIPSTDSIMELPTLFRRSNLASSGLPPNVVITMQSAGGLINHRLICIHVAGLEHWCLEEEEEGGGYSYFSTNNVRAGASKIRYLDVCLQGQTFLLGDFT